MNPNRFISLFLLVAGCLPAAIGSGEETNETIVKILTGRNERIRTQTLASLQRDPRRCLRIIDELIFSARKQAEKVKPDDLVSPSTFQLISLVGSAERPESESLLIELLGAENLGVAMIAAEKLGKNKYYDSIEFLKRQVDRPEFRSNYGFRFNLVRSLALMEHPDAVEFLGVLQGKLDGQLYHRIERLLGEVTESHFLGDEERFSSWKQSRKPEVVFRKAAFESPSLARIRLGEPQKYYGIEIHAKRLMFIIDNSGSMKEYDVGTTRLGRAKQELIRAIEELPNDAEFAILFFSDQVHQWKNELVEADESNKQAAIAFVRRLGAGNWTNTYAALRKSLDFDEELEAVFLLSDGRPTAGKVVAPNLIIRDILHRNRFRHLNFNTIGIAVSGSTEKFLKTLAEESSGEFREAG